MNNPTKLLLLTLFALFSLTNTMPIKAMSSDGLKGSKSREITKNQKDMGLSFGLSLGTEGLGLEAAYQLNHYLAIRGGFSLFPFSYTTAYDMNLDSHIDEYAGYRQRVDKLITQDPSLISIEDKEKYELLMKPEEMKEHDQVDLKGEMKGLRLKVLVDLYPFYEHSFHITGGFFFSTEDRLLTLNGTIDQALWSQINQINTVLPLLSSIEPSLKDYSINPQVEIGDQLVSPDANGQLDAGIEVNSIKPYLGIGFGRAVPHSLVGVSLDMGLMFHGSPKIVSIDPTFEDAINNEREGDDQLKFLDDLVVYPVISLKINFRAF